MNHSKDNNTLNSKKNKYLTKRDRYDIESFKKVGISNRQIAVEIGKSERTIRREINRGLIELKNSDLTYRTVYCADVAQRRYEERANAKGPALKIGHDHELANYIEDKIINDGWSPDVVINRIKKEGLKFKTKICTKTLYSYIDKNVFLNLTNKNLLTKRNVKKNKYKKISKVSMNNKKGRSIEERPEEVNNRKNIGHWEMDCIVSGRGGKAALLVITERHSRKINIFKLLRKTQEEVSKILNKLERIEGYKFKKTYKSITMDNGPEFINQEAIEKSILTKKKRTTAYYAHPYSSWERGSNENSNKIIRRFIPKGSNIMNYSKQEIKRIEHWINNYPRKILNYSTANEVYQIA